MTVRGVLYRSARILGDVQAAVRGPAPLVKRLVRKRALAYWIGLARRFLP